MKVELHHMIHQDAIDLAENMIPADRLEIIRLGREPLEAVQATGETSDEAYAVTVDGVLAGCAGVCWPDKLVDIARPWMLSTPVAHQPACVKDFVYLSRSIISSFRRRYPVLTNWVDADHAVAIRWLRWLGARVDTPEPFGPYGRPFRRFTFDVR